MPLYNFVYMCVCVLDCSAEVVEKEQMLRTRAMRERDEMKMFIKHYRFVLLRVRMPDGLILQGKWTRASRTI